MKLKCHFRAQCVPPPWSPAIQTTGKIIFPGAHYHPVPQFPHVANAHTSWHHPNLEQHIASHNTRLLGGGSPGTPRVQDWIVMWACQYCDSTGPHQDARENLHMAILTMFSPSSGFAGVSQEELWHLQRRHHSYKRFNQFAYLLFSFQAGKWWGTSNVPLSSVLVRI